MISVSTRWRRGARDGEHNGVQIVANRASRRELTRRRILRAAVAEFALRGLDGAAVKTISERAGVANGTVFWHFETKSRLYVEAVVMAADQLSRELMPHVNGASFMQVIDNAVSFLRANPEVDGLLSSLRGEHPRPVVSEAARQVDARAVEIWQRWIARSRTTGRLMMTEISDGNLARLIVVTVSGVLATRFLEEEVDVRTVLADFGALIESPPAASTPVAQSGAN